LKVRMPVEKENLNIVPEVPASLRDVCNNEIVRAALDYSTPIDPYIDRTLEKWRVNLEHRTPAPIYTEKVGGFPVYEGTDYDLSTFLMRLEERQAVINIPEYGRMRRAVLPSNQRIVSSENRHGQIIRLVSNKEKHSFSALIKDYNVIETRPDGREVVGFPRNFTIVDYSGRMHAGWRRLEFRATPEEKKLLEKYKLQPCEGTFEFRNFVHPEMAMLLYSPDFIAAKSLAQRCDEESVHYRAQAKSLEESSIQLPATELKPPVSYLKSEEAVKKVKVNRLVTKVDLPKPSGEFPILGMETDGTIAKHQGMPREKKELQGILRYAKRRANDMSYATGMETRNVTSAVELSAFLYGFKGERRPGNERLPPWIKEGIWSPVPRKWQAMRFSEEVTLNYMLNERTVEVIDSALTDYGPGLLVS
ncbi:MAG: hypothetical protein ABIH76_04065, partial [Candidatus Bathyarchaeota archaeon]